jgi:hypothetical protein
LNGWRSSGRKVFADGLVAKKISSIGDNRDCQSGSSIKRTTPMIKDLRKAGPRCLGDPAYRTTQVQMTTCSKSRRVKDSIHLVTELRKTVASVRVIARSTDRPRGCFR